MSYKIGDTVGYKAKSGRTARYTILAIFGKKMRLASEDNTFSFDVMSTSVIAPPAASEPSYKRYNSARAWFPCGYPGCTQGQHCDDCEGRGGNGRDWYPHESYGDDNSY